MTNVLLIGDVHLSDRAPSSRTGAYADQVLAKIRWCVAEANRLDCPLVFAGDIFHVKTAWRNSYGLVQRLHTELALAARGVAITPGNHDLVGDRLDSLDSQPLGALARMGNVRLLMGRDAEYPQIAGIPYLTEFDGGDWRSALEPWLEKARGAELVVTHAPLFPPGQAPGVYASIDPAEWAEVLNEAGVRETYYGHIHSCHDAYEVAGHGFCNQGALSRGSIHEETVNRRPGVTLWTSTSGS